MAKSEVRNVVILLDGKQVTKSAKEIRKEMRSIRKENDANIIGSKEYKKSIENLKTLKGELDRHRKGVGGVNRAWQSIKQTFVGVGLANIATSIFAKIANFIPQLIQGASKVSDEMSGMQKTIGTTREETKELNKELGKISTRTSRSELRKIATEAGRIGVAKKDIVAFTKEMNKAAVALGDDFGGDASVVSSKLGKLNTLFKETKNIKIADAINKTGSAVNELAANSKGGAPEIAQFATNVGQLSGALKPTIQDALALGAGFAESGLQADNASRAYGIFLGAASTNTDKFAEALGLTVTETENLINTNPADFFLTFSESMKGLPATETSRLLQDLGLNANEVKKIIGAAGENTDRFREIMDLSNKSFEQANSLTNEYNLVNDNLAGKLERVGKFMTRAFTNSAVMDGIEWLVDKAVAFTEVPMSETLRDEQLELNILVQRINDVNTKQEDRNKLLEELNSKYPAFLKNLDQENVSSLELRNRLREVNQGYVVKIALAEMDAEKQEKLKLAADQLKASFDLELQARKKLIKLVGEEEAIRLTTNRSIQEAIDLALQEAGVTEEAIKQDAKLQREGSRLLNKKQSALVEVKNLLNQSTGSQERSNKATEEANKLQEQQNQFRERYNQILKIFDSDGNKTDNEITLEKQLQKVQQSRSKEQLKNNLAELDAFKASLTEKEVALFDFENKRTEAEKIGKGNFGNNTTGNGVDQKKLDAEKQLHQLLFEARATDIQKQLDQELQKWNAVEAMFDEQTLELAGFYEARQQMIDDVTGDFDRKQKEQELEANRKHWEALRAQHEEAQEKKLESWEKQREKHEKILAQEKQNEIDLYNAKVTIWQNTGNAFGSLLTLISSSSEEASGMQKAAALVQIAIDTGVSLSNIIRGAQAAGTGVASVSGPAAPITGPAATAAYYAQGAATMLSGMAQAKRIITQGKGNKKKSFGKGGRLDGPSHNHPSGGFQLFNPISGEIDAVLEGKEPVLSVATDQNNKPIVDMLIDSSQNRNGASILPDLVKGILPELNQARLQQSIQNGTSGANMVALMQYMAANNAEIREIMMEYAKKPNYVNLQQFKEVQAEKDDFFNRAGGSLFQA